MTGYSAWPILLLLSILCVAKARADEPPPILDCTGPMGADAKLVADVQRAWAKHLGEASHEKSFPLEQGGKLRIEMILLPPGKYHRGEGDSAVVITLTEPLWVGKYEVTQHQYESLVGRNPSHFRREELDAADAPVECVSHADARRFCEIASGITNAEFRLLTEAEWEYAGRAGTRTKYYHGDSLDKLGDFAQFAGNNRKSTAKVGSKAPNAFGLFDMFGNVWEWCADYWTPAYDARSTIDPVGPDSGRACVTRGGSWATVPDNLRSAYRTLDAETYAGSHLGFRIARLPEARPLPEPPAILDCTGPEGADRATVLASQKAWAKHFGFSNHQRSFPVDKGGKVWVEMILLPPGKYFQGNEKQPTIVQIKEPLWVGKYEVTQCQYGAVMGNNPSHFLKDGPEAAHHPVEKVSHLDVRKFCEAASANSGAEFRLLREMEWEYAYRAGTRSRYYNGDSHDAIFEIAHCSENNSVSTARCGSKAPNAFGLYDMGGNVAEWCGEPGWVLELPPDPQGLDTRVLRANRGNAWDSQCRSCNATGRSLNTEAYAGSQIGFRLARQVLVRRAARAEPKLRMLDTHVHFFDPNRPTAPPRPNDGKPVPKPILPQDLKELSQPHGVVGCVIVEASSILEDNQWWLDLAAKDAFIVGVIGRLDPASDDFEKNLRRFAVNPLFRGLRMYHNEVQTGLKGNLVERLKLLVELNLTLDVLGGPDTPADAALLAEQLPKLRIVINHAANLRIDGKDPPGKWRDGMAAAAKFPNVYCKVSALVEQTGHKPAPRDLQYYRPVVDTLWELFGEDRLLFGSNWPVSNGGAPYQTVVGIVQDYFVAKGERAAAKFFLGNSQTAYGWKTR
jgi:L-fuconolactonase